MSIVPGSLTAPEHGTVSIIGDEILYTPAPNNNRDVTFQYTVQDTQGNTDTATVTVVITPMDDPPIAGADTYTIPEDSPADLYDVSINDSTDHDPALNEDGFVPTETLTIVRIETAPQNALVCEIVGTQIRYQPLPNYFGPDSLEYVIVDSSNPGVEVTATVTFDVTPVNDPPTITPMADEIVPEDTVITRDFTIADIDDVLTIANFISSR